MRPTAGRWVSGDDFFDREGELRVLESHVHYETRLKDGVDDETFSIAMEILAEAATEGLTSTS